MSDMDINSDEGDGDSILEVTFHFDDAEVDRKGAIERVLQRGKGQSQNTALGGLLR